MTTVSENFQINNRGFMQPNLPSGYNVGSVVNPSAGSYMDDPLQRELKCLYRADQEDLWCAPTTAASRMETDCKTTYSSPNCAYIQPSTNPKLNVAPVIASPIYAHEGWRNSELSKKSSINSSAPTDLQQSGYLINGYIDPAKSYDTNNIKTLHYPIEKANCESGYECSSEFDSFPIQEDFENKKDVYSTCCGGSGDCGKGSNCPAGINSVEVEQKYGVPIDLCASLPGDMDDACGYDPSKSIYAGLPNNQPVGDFDMFPTLKCYNENLGTQTIQPGIYSQTEVAEPQIWNMGISYAQQFEPVEIKTDSFGNKIYVQRDPRINCKNNKPEPYIQTVNESTIYDPRFTGYGDSRRSYVDSNTGQLKFYYDDINAAKQGNFVIKSDIDTLPFADQYGVLDKSIGEKYNLNYMQGVVDNMYIDSSNDFRTDLQERLMRKANEVTRQRRMAPLRRDQGTCAKC